MQTATIIKPKPTSGPKTVLAASANYKMDSDVAPIKEQKPNEPMNTPSAPKKIKPTVITLSSQIKRDELNEVLKIIQTLHFQMKSKSDLEENRGNIKMNLEKLFDLLEKTDNDLVKAKIIEVLETLKLFFPRRRTNFGKVIGIVFCDVMFPILSVFFWYRWHKVKYAINNFEQMVNSKLSLESVSAKKSTTDKIGFLITKECDLLKAFVSKTEVLKTTQHQNRLGSLDQNNLIFKTIEEIKETAYKAKEKEDKALLRACLSLLEDLKPIIQERRTTIRKIIGGILLFPFSTYHFIKWNQNRIRLNIIEAKLNQAISEIASKI